MHSSSFFRGFKLSIFEDYRTSRFDRDTIPVLGQVFVRICDNVSFLVQSVAIPQTCTMFLFRSARKKNGRAGLRYPFLFYFILNREKCIYEISTWSSSWNLNFNFTFLFFAMENAATITSGCLLKNSLIIWNDQRCYQFHIQTNSTEWFSQW